ncbi:hypothetical protein MTR67_044000 [Solanum verrucosum]|uniref:Uncharacterized protein n=1 Tax=Solanum verrucosum TaxID=315347 RepID=A0AAF0ZV83_SOLVR|nr:hypothetical protein MTR67_044000 [Solanum verrucosum]
MVLPSEGYYGCQSRRHDLVVPYYVVLNGNAKSVTLEIPGREMLEWEGSTSLSQLRMLRLSLPLLSLFPVVSEFREVFPTDLSSMPPDRNLDFCIDLETSIHPIFIPPYCMAPAELRELKAQIQELLDKVCISFIVVCSVHLVLRVILPLGRFYIFFFCVCIFGVTVMKGAVSFGDQVEISSGDSSSSNTDDRKTESKWMKNTITVDQPVSEWDSEDQKITRFINASGRVKNIPIPGTVHHDTSSSDVEHEWETKGTQASTFKFMSSRISIPGSSRIAEVDTRNLFILDLKVESSDLDQVKEVPVTCKPKRWWLSMNSGNSSMALESRHHPIPKPLLREWI